MLLRAIHAGFSIMSSMPFGGESFFNVKYKFKPRRIERRFFLLFSLSLFLDQIRTVYTPKPLT
jgi:hypothetical protein